MTPPDDDANDDRLAATLAALTPAQRGRALAYLSGESKSAIARREGVSPQAVDQTLRTAAVRELYSIAGHQFAVESVQRDSSSEKTSLTEALLQNIVRIALNATRPVVYGGCYKLVPDNRLRLEATMKLIEFIEPPEGPTLAAPASQPAASGELVAREKTTVSRTRTREIRRRP